MSLLESRATSETQQINHSSDILRKHLQAFNYSFKANFYVVDWFTTMYGI